jgi:hypothetical protein
MVSILLFFICTSSQIQQDTVIIIVLSNSKVTFLLVRMTCVLNNDMRIIQKIYVQSYHILKEIKRMRNRLNMSIFFGKQASHRKILKKYKKGDRPLFLRRGTVPIFLYTRIERDSHIKRGLSPFSFFNFISSLWDEAKKQQNNLIEPMKSIFFPPFYSFS